MAEMTPPQLADGSLYVFRIGYHLPDGAVLFEEHHDSDLDAAIRYAQGALLPSDATGEPASLNPPAPILISLGEGRMGALPRSRVIYVTAEHVRAEPGINNRRYSVQGWRIVLSKQAEEAEEARRQAAGDSSQDDAVPAQQSSGVYSDEPQEDANEYNITDAETRMGYARGYERGIDDIMKRCEVLLKDTSVLNFLRRHAAARRQDMEGVGRPAQQNDNLLR